MSSISQPLAFVDIETTGGSHFASRVLEVGVVRVENNQVVSTYQTLIHPDEDVPAFITGLTGITNSDVAGSPRFADVADELAEILDGAIFVAHNVRFDYAFLKMEFERLGATFRPPLLCTVRLSRKLYPAVRGHKLSDLIARHGLVAPARHRAYDDAHCLWQFYQLCLAEFDLDTFEAAVKAHMGSQSVPSQLDAEQIAALPEGPGVYIFEDDEGAPLYVGKSVHVRQRVLSHFASDSSRGNEMKLSQAVRKLRAISTHGELSALLLESDMIKDLQPRYNRMLRQRELVTLAMEARDDAGYKRVELRDVREIGSDDTPGLLAVFTTQGRAKQSLQALVSKYRLCPKLLGLERTRGVCFLSQLGKCNGACGGRESVAAYNDRFDVAFENQRVAAWPYRGPVLIREQLAGVPGMTGFVVEGWCLLARLHELPEGGYEVISEVERFDLDRYKIIRQFLQDPRKRRSVQVLSSAQLDELLSPATA